MYRPARDRLQRLPVVFSVAEASRHLPDLSTKALSVYLARYEKAGLIQKAGPRAGLYYNLVQNPDAPRHHRIDAIRKLYPSAVLYGASVLHNAGWTTQIPAGIHIAVLSRQTHPRLYGVELYSRPRSWYQHHHRAGNILPLPPFDSYGLPALAPGACLTDMRQYRDGWTPDPDDIENPDDFIDLEEILSP